METREILNDQTLNDAFKHLIKEEPLFKKVLEDKNYKINLFNKKIKKSMLPKDVETLEVSSVSGHNIECVLNHMFKLLS